MTGRARRLLAPLVSAMLVAALVGLPGPVGMPGIGGASPARADDGSLAITGVRPGPGRVEFFLAARDLPGGATVEGSQVTVRIDRSVLPSTVRTAAGAGRATTRPDATDLRRAVVLVLDASGSMAGARLAAARSAALDYAAAAPADVRLGLVTVSDTPAVALAPTTDRAAFTAAVGRITAKGGTALYDGVLAAGELLDPGRTPQAAGLAERRLVLLSDGEDTNSRTTVDATVRALAAGDVAVDAVLFGNAGGADLAKLATAGGGRVRPAGDAAALRGVFSAMASQFSTPVLVTATVPERFGGRTVTLRVRVSAGGGSAEATADVRMPAAPAAPVAGSVTDPGPVGRPLLLPVAVATLGVGLFLAVLLVLLPVARRSEVQRRLKHLDSFTGAPRGRSGLATVGGSPPPGGPAGGPPAGGAMWQAALSFSERAVDRPGRRERIELALDRAGSPLRAAEWQLVQAGVAAGGGLLLAWPLPWWLGLPLGAAGGWLGARRYLAVLAKRRTRRFADQLPDALHLVVGSLRSGFSLPQSIESVVREGTAPVAGELGRALAETRLGADLEDALDSVGERNASQDMAWLVMAIRIQREVGGNLSETLETAVGTMRERARLFRHVRALSAEGRLSALVLLAMPILLGGWMFLFRRDYIDPLLTRPLGWLMLATSVVMVGFGAFWLSKLVKVEV